MRPLTATLVAAQKALVQDPIVACRVVDAPVEWPRWVWTPIYGPGTR